MITRSVSSDILSGIDFSDLTPIEIPVKIGSKSYVLREASGDVACRYRNKLLQSTRFSDGKPSSIEGMADAEPLLISLCLWEKYDDKGATKERPVLLQEVRSWPSKIQKKLFDTAKRISELDEEETEESLLKIMRDTQKKLNELRAGKAEAEQKNGQTDTEATSD